MLGYGTYDVMVVDRGGITRIGQITGEFRIKFTWERDNIGMCNITVTKPNLACCQLLAGIRSVRHEIVVYRNGYRVWEGPITRMGYFADFVEIEARDVAWYLSRRAMSIPMNFTGISKNAVDAVYEVIEHHYPAVGDMFNIGAYLKKYNSVDDARTAAKHDAYSKTLYEFLDKYVDDGGLDFIVRGRSIIIYDTHTRLSVLPKLSDNDFNDSLGVVEYGSELNTRVFTTNNEAGVGVANAPAEWMDYYGPIERVVTNSDEGSDDSAEEAAVAKVALDDQAERSLNRGYPAPVDILVPANISIKPTSPIEFHELMPGSWVPVEATRVCRPLQQWHRLDSVTTTLTSDGEVIELDLIQAPAHWSEPL